MEVRHLSNKLSQCGDCQQVCAVLLELRPQYGDEQTLLTQIERQQEQDGYQLSYVMDAGEVLCVAGFVVTNKLAWGKSIYIDDLVTSSTQRSRGAGRTLIDWFRRHAIQLGCEQLHLDSGVQRFAAHRFYLREAFKISSHHFSIENLENPTAS